MAPEVFVPLVLLVATVLCAARWGGRPEWLGAGFLLTWFVADFILRLVSTPRGYTSFSLSAAMLDLLAFSGFVVLALRANRLWPIFASAFLTFPVLGHMAVLAGMGGMNWSYWIMTQVPPNAVAMILSVASLRHSRRWKRGVRARDWRAI